MNEMTCMLPHSAGGYITPRVGNAATCGCPHSSVPRRSYAHTQ
jgi:hypothetical protein